LRWMLGFVICLLTLHEDASRTLKTGKREKERENSGWENVEQIEKKKAKPGSEEQIWGQVQFR